MQIKQVFGVILTVFIFAIFLCGCIETDSSNSGVDASRFVGTWVGNMETQMVGFRENHPPMNMTDNFENDTDGNFTDFRENAPSANITQLEFTSDTLDTTITMGETTRTMSYSYTIEGNQLLLSVQFTGEPPDWGQQLPEGDRPPFDDEMPSDDERPPFDGERPFDGENPFQQLSYTFQFNEDNTILYLDGSPFSKIN